MSTGAGHSQAGGGRRWKVAAWLGDRLPVRWVPRWANRRLSQFMWQVWNENNNPRRQH